ncbi:hypothetical protein B9Z55_027361 [Caenorhabditis nigoni]|uniref:Exonuclease domain-containing protein n=1 Tax=Caenorhabditis nigoni TaxID=1611254 RepID=A0A2G5SG84_9PELO|nr:hypothetical protein B9Z55_027361 [Caenorhabditis nigoni]
MANRYRCPFQNLLILDFKTTSEENNFDFPTEIIQISASVLNIRDKLIREDLTFNTFVRPVINPVLSEYCSRLTGSQLSCSNCLQELLSGGEIIVLVVASVTLRLMHSRSQRLFQGDCCGSEDDVRSTALTNSGDVDFGIPTPLASDDVVTTS